MIYIGNLIDCLFDRKYIVFLKLQSAKHDIQLMKEKQELLREKQEINNMKKEEELIQQERKKIEMLKNKFNVSTVFFISCIILVLICSDF